MARIRVMFVLGTRPEVIKLAPVIRAARTWTDEFETVVVSTGQHRELLDPLLEFFEIAPEFDLRVLKSADSPTEVAADVLRGLQKPLEDCRPNWVIVQGDTTSVVAGALAAFYARVKVAHVEAGLRTYDRFRPFPEEVNRRATSAIVDLHLAPTERSRENLLKENVAEEDVVVTGNTVVDALLHAHRRVTADPARLAPVAEKFLREHVGNGRFVLMTAHRRENIGQGFLNICRAVARLAEENPKLHFVCPVHLNPDVRATVLPFLSGYESVHLIDPVAYGDFVYMLARCTLVLTDSGGIQEEAPSLGKPVLVMRSVTERPEGVEAGSAILVGTEPERIVSEVTRLLESAEDYRAIAQIRNPYGDGEASGRILDAIAVSSRK